MTDIITLIRLHKSQQVGTISRNWLDVFTFCHNPSNSGILITTIQIASTLERCFPPAPHRTPFSLIESTASASTIGDFNKLQTGGILM